MGINLSLFPIPEMGDSVSTFTGKLHEGFVALAAGDTNLAHAYLNDYLSANPRSEHGLLLKGIAEARVGNVESAISFFSQSIDATPGNANAFYSPPQQNLWVSFIEELII